MTVIFRVFVKMVLVTCFLSLPHAALADDAADEAAIRALWDSYAEARVAGDVAAYLELWDENAIKIGDGNLGRRMELVARGLPGRFRREPYDAMEIEVDEVVVSGDWAFSRVTFTVELGRHRIVGAFLSVLLRQEDGSWRIYRDMSNRALILELT